MSRAVASIAVCALLGACVRADGGAPVSGAAAPQSPPGLEWRTLGVFGGPSATAAVLSLLAMEHDRSYRGPNMTKCLAAGIDDPVADAELAYVRTQSTNVHNRDRCKLAADTSIVDAVTGEAAVIVRARQYPVVEGGVVRFNGGWTHGEQSGVGWGYRVTRVPNGWLIEQDNTMTVA